MNAGILGFPAAPQAVLVESATFYENGTYTRPANCLALVIELIPGGGGGGGGPNLGGVYNAVGAGQGGDSAPWGVVLLNCPAALGQNEFQIQVGKGGIGSAGSVTTTAGGKVAGGPSSFGSISLASSGALTLAYGAIQVALRSPATGGLAPVASPGGAGTSGALGSGGGGGGVDNLTVARDGGDGGSASNGVRTAAGGAKGVGGAAGTNGAAGAAIALRDLLALVTSYPTLGLGAGGAGGGASTTPNNNGGDGGNGSFPGGGGGGGGSTYNGTGRGGNGGNGGDGYVRIVALVQREQPTF